ncbi:uncharacterized protein BJ171DRAFT_422843 [Polychytrium aggregatum]|uniref:uncharacterized protein n=1 Tax=Polychytrium aggregatum TaxID=110093 RepID=UPI0022FEEDAD|nr:uncharacterized protein BJ171DRAFT_422843 [Polychytrium aggregatum]KAI9205663.1 hypothetical protein BJ171DRAFT_422843 [Polychytrium aggregatum]
MTQDSHAFTGTETRNITLYIIGIMTYKFSLETMNACMSGIVLNRLAQSAGPGVVWANLVGINLGCQCLGSLLVGPLVKRYQAKNVLSLAILLFGIAVVTIPILEGATGGTIPAVLNKGSSIKSTWGGWTPYLIFVFFPLAGIFHGMVELMRRVIPADLVGGDALKLKRLDATVHIFYEITGTAGAILASIWISYFGWGFALGLLPVGFTLSSCIWFLITTRPERIKLHEEFKQAERDIPFGQRLGAVVYSFFHSVYLGARLVCSQRALVWLLPAYTLPLVLHRYLENTLAPFYAKSVLGNSDMQTIMVGGSNFGELLGALTVLLLARQVKTPIPFLRLDAILLLLIWALPFIPVDKSDIVGFTWKLTPLMATISFGWAAGDVSLAAFVQSRLEDYANIDKYTSPLSAVMSFLYVAYLLAFYILNLLMGTVRDDFVLNNKSLRDLFIYIGGVFMTLAGIVIVASTFIPRGSFAMNPDPDTVEFNDDIQVTGIDKKPADEKKGELDDTKVVSLIAA